MTNNLPLTELLDGWLVTLRGQRKSPHTLEGYRSSVQSYIRFHGPSAELTKAGVLAYLAQTECQSSTARLHLTVLKLFARWLADEEGFDADPILTIKHPKTDEKTVPNLTADEVVRLIKACGDKTFRDKRDRAMVVLMTETGLRSGELLALDVVDVNVAECILHVVRGKGGKGRRVKFSPTCAAVVDRYRRARRQAGWDFDSGPLFVAERGHKRLSYTGMVSSLKARAAVADVKGFHVHRLRHTAAVRWLKSGGSETGLMAQSGWKSRTMIDRYVKSASEELAAEEFDRLGLGLV